MKKDKKKELYFWKRHFGIMNNNLDSIPTEVDRLNLRIQDTEVDDQWLRYIAAKIKIVNRIDLDDTLITDEGIKHLSKLESVKELRLKGCHYITNESLDYLNKLTGLEVLHLAGTQIKLNAIEELISLQNLKKLFLSTSDSEEIITAKVQALKRLFPQCEIIVNAKSYD